MFSSWIQDDIIQFIKSLSFTPTNAEVRPKIRPDDKTSNVTESLHKIDQIKGVYEWNNKDLIYNPNTSTRFLHTRLWPGTNENKNFKPAFPPSTECVDRLDQLLARTKTDSETKTKYEKRLLLEKCKINEEATISCIIWRLPKK